MSGATAGLLALAWLSWLWMSAWRERQMSRERARADALTNRLVELSRERATLDTQALQAVFDRAMVSLGEMTSTVSALVSPPPPTPSVPAGLASQLVTNQEGPWSTVMHPSELREEAERTSPVMGWSTDPATAVAEMLNHAPEPEGDPYGSGLPLGMVAYDPERG